MQNDNRVMLVSGIFLGFVLGIVFVESLEIVSGLVETAQEIAAARLGPFPESRGDAVAAESKDG